MQSSKLLLVGPNRLSRAVLTRLIDKSSFIVVGEIADAARMGAAADDDPTPVPDLAVVECPGDADVVLDVLDHLTRRYPLTPVVVLSDEACMATLVACLAAGARGFLTKDISREALLGSLQLVMLGETVLPTSLADLLATGIRARQREKAAAGNDYDLSDREVETVQCLLRGESNKVIANRFDIAEATIKVHIKSILRKIKANNRTQAAIWAHSRGYLPIDDELGISRTAQGGDLRLSRPFP